MNGPRKRMWLYTPPEDPRELEVVILGPLDQIGSVLARIKGALERWYGFERVEIVASGLTVGAMRAHQNENSVYDDPITEMRAMMITDISLSEVRFDWCARSPMGIVCTW